MAIKPAVNKLCNPDFYFLKIEFKEAKCLRSSLSVLFQTLFVLFNTEWIDTRMTWAVLDPCVSNNCMTFLTNVTPTFFFRQSPSSISAKVLKI